MSRIVAVAILVLLMLGSCDRNDETNMDVSVASVDEESTGEDSQHSVMTDQELIQLLEQIDDGDFEPRGLESHIGTRLPSRAFLEWVQDRSLQDPLYGGGVFAITSNSGDILGSLYTAYMLDRVVLLYARAKETGYLVSDWLIVHKRNRHVTIKDLFSIDDLSDPSNPNLGERLHFQFGLVHFDFERHPLVYDEWFHPEAVIRIDINDGTLRYSEEVASNEYVIVEGV